MKDRIATFKDYVGELTAIYRRTELATVKIKSSLSIETFIRPFFDKCMDDHEEAKVVHLNRKNEVVNVHHVSSGSDVGTLIPIKDILRQSILIKTCAIVLIHNHPSGNLNPSKADIDVSNKLRDACNLIEIKLLDSIIITRESYKSLADEGLL